MFAGCTSLYDAPSSLLPATTLASGCYGSMFLGCTSLVFVPELLADTLVDRCYEGMFYGCSQLKQIICLATNIDANKCTNDWVKGVASSGTFIKASGINWPTGRDGIPSGWEIVEY